MKNKLTAALILTLMLMFVANTSALAQEADWRAQMRQSLSARGMSSSAVSQSEDFLARFEQAAKDAKAPSWEDVSSAPSFPVPVFRGNQTTYLAVDERYMMGQASNDIKTLTVRTRDDASQVLAWYKQNLPSSGWSVDNFARGTTSGASLRTEITAKRAGEVAKISIAGSGTTSRDPMTCVSLMYLKKAR